MSKIVQAVVTVAAVVVGTIIGGPVVGAIAGAVVSTGSALLFPPKFNAPEPILVDQEARLLANIDLNAPRKMVLGYTAMATDIRYEAWDKEVNPDYLYRIIAVAAHKVHSIEEIWIDSELVWDSTNGVAANYVGYLTVSTILEGTAGNAAAIPGTAWTADCRLTGCAYIRLDMKVTSNDKDDPNEISPFASNISNRLTIKGAGLVRYDPRLDTTVTGGSGSHRADDQSTWTYVGTDQQRNLPLHILAYLLGYKINGVLSVGKNIPKERIDMESFITAANEAEEAVALSAGGNEMRYGGGAVISENDPPSNVLKTLSTACNAILTDAGGKIAIKLVSNDLATPVAEFTDDDFLDNYSWKPWRPAQSTPNVIRGRFADPSDEGLYQLRPYTPVSTTSPDGIARYETLELAVIESNAHCQRIAKGKLQRYQYPGVFTARMKLSGLAATIGDPVTITFGPLGWTAKNFRIQSQSVADGVLEVTFSEEHASFYAWSAEDSAPIQSATPQVFDPTGAPILQQLAYQLALTGGKITTFFQAGPPVANAEGDLWFDTDDGNKLYRWDGGAWVDAEDTGIAQAIADAAGAQATADGKVTTFYQTSPPTAEGVGDLWIDTDDGNRLRRWDGASWVDARDATIAAAQADASQAISDAAGAQATADGKVTTFFQASPPTAEGTGDLWIDTDDGDRLYRWNGGSWVDIQDGDISQAITDAATAQATADGKITTFYQASAPTAEGVGDFWIDTDDKNHPYRWSGIAWESIQDESAFYGQEIEVQFDYTSLAEFQSEWRAGTIPPDFTASTGALDVPGGTYNTFGNNSGNDEIWVSWDKEPLAFDPDALYEVEFLVRQQSGTGKAYFGLVGLAADKTTWVNTGGSDSIASQHYVAGSNLTVPSSWTWYRGYVKGHAASGSGQSWDKSNPGHMHTNTRYIAPMLLMNYADVAGQANVGYCRLRKVAAKGFMTDTFVNTDNWTALLNSPSFAVSNNIFQQTQQVTDTNEQTEFDYPIDMSQPFAIQFTLHLPSESSIDGQFGINLSRAGTNNYYLRLVYLSSQWRLQQAYSSAPYLNSNVPFDNRWLLVGDGNGNLSIFIGGNRVYNGLDKDGNRWPTDSDGGVTFHTEGTAGRIYGMSDFSVAQGADQVEALKLTYLTEGGADITRTVNGPSEIIVEADSTGTLKANQLGNRGTFKLVPAGQSALTSGVSWSLTTITGSWSGTAASISGSGNGILNLASAPNGTVELDVTASYNGKSYPPFRCKVKKVNDVSIPQGDTEDSTTTWSSMTGTTYTQLLLLTVTTPSSAGDVNLTADTITINHDRDDQIWAGENFTMRWQRSPAGAGTWTTIGTTQDSEPDPYTEQVSPPPGPLYTAWPGSITINRTDTTAANSTAYDYRLQGKWTSVTTVQASFSGTASVEAT